MSDATERKLEWACREIEHLLNKVGWLQGCVKRLEQVTEPSPGGEWAKQEAIAWSRPIWPCKVWYAESEAGLPPRIQNWWIPSPKPDKSDPTVIPGFAIARCVINGQEYAEISCYLPRFDDLDEYDVDGNTAMLHVEQKLVDRLCRKGVLTTEKSFSNPTGEPRIR